jgi:hypothetical protein
VKKGLGFLSMIILLLLSTACSLHANVEDLYEQAKPLNADILLPENISLHQKQALKVRLTQEGKIVEDATSLQFEIWNKDHPEDRETVVAQYEGNGMYRSEKTFNEDGIYYVKADVKARNLHVMPTKLVIVGKVSEKELQSLHSTQDHTGHHNHH